MILFRQAIRSHLLSGAAIESALCTQACFASRRLPLSDNEAEVLNCVNSGRPIYSRWLFHRFSIEIFEQLPAREFPGGRLLAPLAPDRSGEAEMLQLFHWGFDGMVILDANRENRASPGGSTLSSSAPGYRVLVMSCQRLESE